MSQIALWEINLTWGFLKKVPAVFKTRYTHAHFADDQQKCIFVELDFQKNFFQISLKFIGMGPINNNTSLVQIMAWH